MTFRRITLACGSMAVGVVLIELLIHFSGVKWEDVLAHLPVLDWGAFLRLSALMAVNIYLSSWKWQLVDRASRRPTDRPVSESTSFALTSIGTALGQVVPMQFAAPLARTAGTWTYGSAIRRGTLSTFVEQASDLVIVCFLALASVATILLHGKAWTWLAVGLVIWAMAMLSLPSMLPILRRLAGTLAVTGYCPARWRKAVAELSDSRLLNVKLGRQLMAISTLRFAVLVLMAAQTTAAIRCDVPLWCLMAAMPIVVLSSAIGITPGGLGFTEFGYSAMLVAYGIPLSTATQWALTNRLLTSAAAFIVTLVVVPILFSIRTIPAHSPDIERSACE